MKDVRCPKCGKDLVLVESEEYKLANVSFKVYSCTNLDCELHEESLVYDEENKTFSKADTGNSLSDQ